MFVGRGKYRERKRSTPNLIVIIVRVFDSRDFGSKHFYSKPLRIAVPGTIPDIVDSGSGASTLNSLGVIAIQVRP
jgi:hypothetical protein